MLLRHQQPVERLLMSALIDPHTGRCSYCKNDDGRPGIVKMWRDQNTLKLLPDKCSCLLCGQRYYVAEEDLATFIGYDPSWEV